MTWPLLAIPGGMEKPTSGHARPKMPVDLQLCPYPLCLSCGYASVMAFFPPCRYAQSALQALYHTPFGCAAARRTANCTSAGSHPGHICYAGCYCTSSSEIASDWLLQILQSHSNDDHAIPARLSSPCCISLAAAACLGEDERTPQPFHGRPRAWLCAGVSLTMFLVEHIGHFAHAPPPYYWG